MSDQRHTRLRMPYNDTDAGEPLENLRELERDTSASFLQRIRSRIHRRTTASQLAIASWHLPKIVLAELVSVFAYMLGARGGRKRE